MKNFLRKLHIGDSAGDGASSPAPPQPSSKKGGGGSGAGAHHEHKHASGISSWLSSVTGRPHPHQPPPPPLPAAAATAAAAAEAEAGMLALVSSVEETRLEEEEMARRESRQEEQRKREMEEEEKQEVELEEYHMQLALEMSAREDPEAMQIEVAKQISLGSCPLQSSAAEVVAFRYWSFNALSYDDKILDGFYDICVIGDEPTLATIPSLMDLQEQPFSHGAKTEAVLVNRAQDSELVELEQKAFIMAVEIRSKNSEFVGCILVQRLAILVANYMGGPVFDPESMLLKYQNMSSLLRASMRSAVMPLGRLTIGLVRHRRCFFKALADNLAVPCRLVKGRQYTGSDDGALSIVKFNDGREYIVDLMSDPGTLIPSDSADLGRECEESFFADNHHVNKDDSNTQLGSSFSEASSSVYGSFENKSLEKGSTPSNTGHSDPYDATTGQIGNQGSVQSSSFGELSVSTCASENLPIIHESRNTDHTMTVKNKEKSVAANNSSSSSPSSSEVGSAPAVRRMKVKDVSEYMISAAKENPQLAEKIHAVLLESGVLPPPDLFSEESREQPKDLIVYDTSLFQTKDEMIKRMNELESTAHADRGHGPSLPHHPGHEIQTKVVPYQMPLDLKPVQGTNPSFPLCEQSALPQEDPLQLIKQMPVTAAAVATAAVVASSMVVAAAKSNSDIILDVPVAAAATAAAVVATTAAVNKQYEYLDPGCQLLGWPSSSEANELIRRVRHDFWDKYQLGIDHAHDNALEQEKGLIEAPQIVERISDKSTGTESTRSDRALDDVAELEIQWEEITLGERIGLGSFGEVFRGEWHGTEVAVKKFLQQDISSDALEEFRTEVRIMKRLRHPNVVLFMGAVTHVPNLSIVTEFLPRGSLFQLIHRTNNQLDERKRLRMALDVARGMNYLHNCTPVIVHRDLKSPNLLVDKNWVVKVCDFGLSRMKHSTFLSSRSTAGTAEWMAPEVLRNEPLDEKCDVFSYGVILWELCTLLQPWEGMNPMQVVGAVGFQQCRLDIPADVDPAVAGIIERCWQTDPKMRPSFSEIMAALKPLLKNLPANQPTNKTASAKNR